MKTYFLFIAFILSTFALALPMPATYRTPITLALAEARFVQEPCSKNNEKNQDLSIVCGQSNIGFDLFSTVVDLQLPIKLQENNFKWLSSWERSDTNYSRFFWRLGNLS